jgi:DNA-binding MarR family transcriptional regulator
VLYMQQHTLPDFECACATIRRAARLVTQLYDDEMRGTLEGPQFSLLTAIERRPGVTQNMLARALALDKTTLSRNLGLMVRKGWIERGSESDFSERGFRLTSIGSALLTSAKPG